MINQIESIILTAVLLLLPLDNSKADQSHDQRSALNRPGRIYADHSLFPELQQNFNSPNQIMKVCSKCHNRSKEHINEVLHWIWQCNDQKKRVETVSGQGPAKDCLEDDEEAMSGNCLDCHSDFQDFSNVKNQLKPQGHKYKIDCLICHSTNNHYADYLKASEGLFPELSKEMMVKITKDIDYPTRANCGNCHFKAKHTSYNDLGPELINPDKETDVHMNSQGSNFRCRTCHTTFKHVLSNDCLETSLGHKRQQKIFGKNIGADKMDLSSCESCHSMTPHKGNKQLDNHTDIVSCQACHIPRVKEDDQIEYHWYDGTNKTYQQIQEHDGQKILVKNAPMKKRNDYSRIFPFRVTQEEVDQQSEGGAEGVTMVKTYWPVNHRVAPKEQALECKECHSPDDNNKAIILGTINDTYFPGNYDGRFDIWIYLLVAMTMLGVSVHGGGRLTAAILRNIR